MTDIANPPPTRSRSSIARPVQPPHTSTYGTNRLPVWIALAALIVIYAVLFGWLSLERYWSYEMHALDMGNMGQAAWNTVHGHPFAFTNMRLQYWIEAWNTQTRLSFHVEALFPVISPVYLIYPHPESLLVLQTIALSLGAIPVYFLARDKLRSPLIALDFALVYLLFPSLQALNLYEFHPVALATPLLLAAFLFVSRRRYMPFAICALAAMGTKEQIGLVVAMFGLYILLVQKERRWGVATFLVGASYSLFAAIVVEKHFRRTPTLTYMENRYGYLGHGLHGAIHTITHDPGIFFQVVFTWPKFWYLEHLLAPTGFLALLSPATLLLALPTVALNLLSQDFHMYSGLGDNSAEIVAVVMISAILGAALAVRGLSIWLRERTALAVAGIFVLLMALLDQRLNGYSPLGVRFEVPSIGTHQKIADRFVSMIPEGVPVSTQDQLDPHLSSRRYLYLFEDTGRQPPLVPANYILLDASAPTYPLPSYQIHDRAVQWINHPGWGVAAAQDGLILIKKGAPSRQIPAAFYTYMYARPSDIQHPAYVVTPGVEYLGYSRQETDLVNHRVPVLNYTVYLRPTGHLSRNLEPVLYETMDGKPIGCSADSLGLAWLPTSRWNTGRTYAVRIQPLETSWETAGTAHLQIELRPLVHYDVNACQRLWAQHGRLLSAGTLGIGF